MKGTKRDTTQVVDTWSARVRHQVTGLKDSEFGWDGKSAWTMGADSGVNARFWALTPYYFVAMPFVFADPGVNFAYEGEFKFENRTFDQIKITFGENVGDSPDDFYVVLIDKKTKILAGTRYIVSYKGFFKDGGHTPEKLMMYDGVQKISGIVFPTAARSFEWVEGKPGALTVQTKISEIEFVPKTEKNYFDVPKGAVLQKSM